MLIIISQTKSSIVKPRGIYRKQNMIFACISGESDTECFKLGEYNSIDRTIEVMNTIIKMLSSEYNRIYQMPRE